MSYWSKFALIYGCGVLAATSLGKIAPISVQLSADLRLPLDQMALVASSTTTVAALFGVPTSQLIGRLPPGRAVAAGCLIMALASFLGARSEHFVPLLATRLVESLGYVAIVVAAPVLITGMGGGDRRTTALAVWGTFLPVGLALGSFGGGLLSSWYGWRNWLSIEAAVVLLAGILAAPALGRTAGSAPEPSGRARISWRELRRPVLLAVGLAMTSATIVAVISLFPTYLHQAHGMPTAMAGTLTGSVSLIGVIGGFFSGWLLNRGVPARRVFVATLLMPVGAAVAFLGSGATLLCLAGAVLIALSNELVVAAVFASTPAVTDRASDIRLTNGLIAQVGSIGSLAGPPLAGAAVLAASGWWAMAPTTLVMSAIGVLALRGSVRQLESQRRSESPRTPGG